jgi:hypothetical protein
VWLRRRSEAAAASLGSVLPSISGAKPSMKDSGWDDQDDVDDTDLGATSTSTTHLPTLGKNGECSIGNGWATAHASPCHLHAMGPYSVDLVF